MRLAPVLREVAAEGGGEDGALELLEERGDAVEGLLGLLGVREKGVDLVDDAPLLRSWWKADSKLLNLREVDRLVNAALAKSEQCRTLGFE